MRRQRAEALADCAKRTPGIPVARGTWRRAARLRSKLFPELATARRGGGWVLPD